MNVKELGNRPQMYLFSDGVAELMIGLFMFLYSAALSLIVHLPKNWGYGWGGFAGPILLALGGFGMMRGMKLLRERVTSPRGGYVVPYVAPRNRLVWALGGGIMAATFGGLLALFHHSEAEFWCAVFGLAYAITGCYIGWPICSCWRRFPARFCGGSQAAAAIWLL